MADLDVLPDQLQKNKTLEKYIQKAFNLNDNKIVAEQMNKKRDNQNTSSQLRKLN